MKIKNAFWMEIGYLILIIIHENKEYQCCMMHKDLDVKPEIDDEARDQIFQFATNLKQKVKKNTEEFLSDYKGKGIFK